MKSLSIIATTILACVVYDIIHDQITARLCVQYFTVFHPPVFSTQDPTLFGIGWGTTRTKRLGPLIFGFTEDHRFTQHALAGRSRNAQPNG